MTVSDKDFDNIVAGLNEAVAIETGRADPDTYRVHVPAQVDVKAVRGRLGLSQKKFAMQFGFTASAVRDWEQGRRTPEASARVLLTVIDREPEVVMRALATA